MTHQNILSQWIKVSKMRHGPTNASPAFATRRGRFGFLVWRYHKIPFSTWLKGPPKGQLGASFLRAPFFLSGFKEKLKGTPAIGGVNYKRRARSLLLTHPDIQTRSKTREAGSDLRSGPTHGDPPAWFSQPFPHFLPQVHRPFQLPLPEPQKVRSLGSDPQTFGPF